jgi:hypothetical protein
MMKQKESERAEGYQLLASDTNLGKSLVSNEINAVKQVFKAGEEL